VEFESTDSDRGPKAISVRIIDKRADLSGPSPWAVSPVTARLATTVPSVPRPAPPADAPAPRPAAARKEAADTEDDLCDVLTASAFSHDLTEQLLNSMPALTAGQITKLRETFLAFAREHNWVEN
jgi:CspA family cold shock protein